MYRWTEMWVYTMAKELSKKHDVYVYTKFPWEVSDRIKEFATITDKKTDADLILFNHYTTCEWVWKGFKVHTRHWPKVQLEVPTLGCDRYVSVSEEVQEASRTTGYGWHKFESVVIRNGIDLERYKPTKKVTELKNILYLSNNGEVEEKIKRACKELNLNYTKIWGVWGNADEEHGWGWWDIPTIINEHDLVITIGRGVYESFACGRPVIVYDKHGMDGYMTREKFFESRQNNCSGRRYALQPTVGDLMEEIKKFQVWDGEINRWIAEEELDIKKKAEEYISLM